MPHRLYLLKRLTTLNKNRDELASYLEMNYKAAGKVIEEIDKLGDNNIYNEAVQVFKK